MASFATHAELLTPEDIEWKAYEAGIKKNPPGRLLQNVLEFNKGAYETKMKLSDKDRDAIRKVAELTSDDELLSIANLPEVTISLEKFRTADPKTTRITIGWELNYTPAESEALGLKHKGAFDPRNTMYIEK